MRKTFLALTTLALAAVACSSAPPSEPADSKSDPLVISHFNPWMLDPSPDFKSRATGTFAYMSDTTCADIAVYDGVLRGRPGLQWMEAWGLGSQWPYFQGVFKDVEALNPQHFTVSMLFGWQPFCVYSFQPVTAAETLDLAVPSYHYDSLTAAGATVINTANTPYWMTICPQLHAPCPSDPCTCPPDTEMQ